MDVSPSGPNDHDLHASLLCETCESPIDLLEDIDERGVCRHCGLAFDLGPPAAHRYAG